MAQKTLVCTLCSHTIDSKKIITLFEKEEVHRIKQCTNCNTLHPIKKSSIKRWLALAFKHPFRFKAHLSLAKKQCISCDPQFLVAWNGRCPLCNSELLLRVA